MKPTSSCVAPVGVGLRWPLCRHIGNCYGIALACITGGSVLAYYVRWSRGPNQQRKLAAVVSLYLQGLCAACVMSPCTARGWECRPDGGCKHTLMDLRGLGGVNTVVHGDTQWQGVDTQPGFGPVPLCVVPTLLCSRSLATTWGHSSSEGSGFRESENKRRRSQRKGTSMTPNSGKRGGRQGILRGEGKIGQGAGWTLSCKLVGNMLL